MSKQSRVFICHASQDFAIAMDVCRCFESEGRPCWIAPRDVPPDKDWVDEVRKGIDGSRVLILIHSEAARTSPSVLREVSRAVSQGLGILPIRLDGAPFSPGLEYYLSSLPVLDVAVQLSTFHIENLKRRVNELLAPGPWVPNIGIDFGTTNSSICIGKDAGWDSTLIADLGSTSTVADEERAGTPALPGAVTDLVRFAVTAPSTVSPGTRFLIDVWAHLEGDREEVLRRARQAANTDDIFYRDRGPVRITRGQVLTLCLRPIDGAEIMDAEDTLYWEGAIGNASFPVTVSSDAAAGKRHGTLSVLLEGLTIAKLHFVIDVGVRSTAPAELPTNVQQFKTAFASYASDDRDHVLRVIQGIQKAAPDLQVFVDVAHLRSGQRWEDELWKVIPTRDVFYLFWSRAAAQSEFVDKEWRCALSSRGLDFIDPAPLQGPRAAPPPPELKRLHFNDWVLAYMRAGIDITT